MEISQNTESLSIRLRNETKIVHTKTENADFIKKLFKAEFTPEEYFCYLASLKEIYQTLEQALLKNKNQPYVEPIYFEELFRTQSLNEDLVAWSEYKADLNESQLNAVKEYTTHLNKISEAAPHLLVSHAYVRYLGDLSGGQILHKILSAKVDKANGLNFYSFKIDNTQKMKELYRSRLDQIGSLSEPKSCEILKEAQLAFHYNDMIFNTLSKSS